jgi:hypothetical protein
MGFRGLFIGIERYASPVANELLCAGRVASLPTDGAFIPHQSNVRHPPLLRSRID